ncbi:uncharacterized protein LOC133196250 [Saccostrea echinata]|uniref:uncharacterized protein LOC133196250 n=1 Tax=Saccostrea echinata TaxID=191078 RepID=UPI002A8041F1|nr:uncharacterized protein LOC133196250 [Saccostrea echinata]
MADMYKSCSSIGSLAISHTSFTGGKEAGVCQTSMVSDKGRKIQLLKMLCLTLVPTLGLWVFCAFQLTTEVNIRRNYEKSIESLTFSINVGKLIHHLQNERDLSILYLSAIGPETKSFLLQEYTITDEFIESLQMWPGNLDRYNRPAFRSKNKLIAHLGRHRQNLDGSTIDQEHVFYSSIIDIIVHWGYETISESKFAVIWKSFVAFQKITVAKENLGVERAFGTMFFASGGFENHKQYETYNINSFGFQENYVSARMYSPHVGHLDLHGIESFGINVSVTIRNFRKYVKEFGEEEQDPAKADIQKARWHYDNVTKYLDTLLSLQTTLGYICMSKLSTLAERAKTGVFINIFLLVFVLLSCSFLIFCVENQTSNIQKFAGILVDRTKELNVEKKKTDSLLYQMIPKSVAKKLKRNDDINAEYFKSVTVFFSDIEGFSYITRSLSPLRLVELLNVLYGAIDNLVDQKNLYKVETINDSYMIVSGLPKRNKDHHASEIADFAIALQKMMMMKTFYEFGRRHIQLKIGINSGSCMAGIVGSKLPRYCLFGDTINVASRMKSTGLRNQIHISHSTYTLLAKTGKYTILKRGIVNIKGKGEMPTYWLTDIVRSNSGSIDVDPNGSPVSNASFELICEMLQNRCALSRALGMNPVLPCKTMSLTDIGKYVNTENTNMASVSTSRSDETSPFNAFQTVMGRKKTEICIDEFEPEKDSTDTRSSVP